MGESSSAIPSEELPSAATAYQAIPFDLFVTKKYKHLTFRGGLRFTDSAGNLVYEVQKSDGQSPDFKKKLLLDSQGNTLVSLHRVNKGSWRGFKGNDEEDLMFTVEKTIDVLNRKEFKIKLVAGKDDPDSNIELEMRGSPLKRSSTLYKGDSIVAQTSLMYTLGFKKIFVPRSRFRLTIFPGFSDTSLIASLIVLYFDGRRLLI